MEELVGRIRKRVGINELTAHEAVAVIMTFLYEQGPSDKVKELALRLDGVDYLRLRESGSPVRLRGFGNLGGVIGAVNELKSLGLGMGQIQGVTYETIAFAREKAGDELVNDIIGAIPGLSQFGRTA